MKLYGGFGSPFTRRVGTTLRIYKLEHEHIVLRGNIPDQLERLKRFNPLGRVPALETENGAALADSATILDYLDHLVGPENSLTPFSGEKRTEVMNIIGIATGAVEKSINCYYEEGVNAKRPSSKVHRPWVDKMYEQTKDGLEALEKMTHKPWLMGKKLTQADVSLVCFWDFIVKNRPATAPALNCPKLENLAKKANAMPEFSETAPE